MVNYVPEPFLLFTENPPQMVYRCLEDDGGEAYAVSQETGMKHLSVTLDPNGLAPSFPCPESQLRHAR